MRALLAVFDPENRELLKRQLEGNGHSVVAPDDLTSALDLHRGERFPLALVEVSTEALDRALETKTPCWGHERNFRELVETMNEGLGVRDEDGVIVYTNHHLCRMLGYGPGELVGRKVSDLIAEDDRPRFASELKRREQGMAGAYEIVMTARDGSRVETLQSAKPLYGSDGEVIGSFAVITDITERKRAEKMLHHNAFHDALTGLPNRALFMDRLQHCMNLSRRRPELRFAVLFLDLDRFKGVNDSLGHVVGDQLLVHIASRLEAALRSVDTVARIGGDEFLVLVEDVVSDDDALLVAERLQSDLKRAFHVEGKEILTSVSIGIAFGEPRYRWALDILRDADLAMYRSKAQGGGCTTVFDREMRRHAVRMSAKGQRAVGER